MSRFKMRPEKLRKVQGAKSIVEDIQKNQLSICYVLRSATEQQKVIWQMQGPSK